MLFKSPNEFSLYIEELAKDKDDTLIDTILDYCKENFMDPEDISKMISRPLKDKLEVEFMEMSLLPKVAQLEY